MFIYKQLGSKSPSKKSEEDIKWRMDRVTPAWGGREPAKQERAVWGPEMLRRTMLGSHVGEDMELKRRLKIKQKRWPFHKCAHAKPLT